MPTQTRTDYDGAGRAIASVFQPYDEERWRTKTYYAGDRTDVTPPGGGTATSTVTDARDRAVQLRQYHGPAPTPTVAGSWDTTTYTYNRKGQTELITDPAGNSWKYTYDLRGRQATTEDPDRGITTFTYDNAGRVKTTTDARQKTIAFVYDGLNRKRFAYDNQVGGTMRAQWIYDTLAKGYLTQSTRFLPGGANYHVKVTGYTDTYQPEGTEYIIPASETGLGAPTPTQTSGTPTHPRLTRHAFDPVRPRCRDTAVQLQRPGAAHDTRDADRQHHYQLRRRNDLQRPRSARRIRSAHRQRRTRLAALHP